MKTILFVCVHNAGRSQMAKAFLNHAAKEQGLDIRGESAGTIAGNTINPVAIQVMDEIGISLEGHTPKKLTSEMIKEASQIITMGCGVDAEACPAKFYVTDDWGLDDPKGQPIETVRTIRDQIKDRIDSLIDQIKKDTTE